MANPSLAPIDRRQPRIKNELEFIAWEHGDLICGIDEVGRGCTAGPVLAAAVILKTKTRLEILRDSKTLRPNELIETDKWIRKNAIWAIGTGDSLEIDSANIVNATVSAMRRALYALLCKTGKITFTLVVDAVPLEISRTLGCKKVAAFPKGEDYSCSVAAASIVAKVARDKLMCQLGKYVPAYQFPKHKGYNTKTHQAAIKNGGMSVVHRHRFLNKSETHAFSRNIDIF